MATAMLGQQGRLPPPPPVDTLTAPDIRFCHPGYQGEGVSNQLISLPRVDTEDNQEFGVHHTTALVACQIIAGNRFDEGYFSLSPTGQPIQTLTDSVLTQDLYYFVISGCKGIYRFYFAKQLSYPLLPTLSNVTWSVIRTVPDHSKLSRVAISPRPYPSILASTTCTFC